MSVTQANLIHLGKGVYDQMHEIWLQDIMQLVLSIWMYPEGQILLVSILII